MRTGEFCWCKVLLPACPCRLLPVHLDLGEDAGVLLNSVICTDSVPFNSWSANVKYLVGFACFNGNKLLHYRQPEATLLQPLRNKAENVNWQASLGMPKYYPQKISFPWGSIPHLIHGSVGPMSPRPKRNLDRLSHFCRALSHDCTDRPHYNCNSRLHLLLCLQFPPS